MKILIFNPHDFHYEIIESVLFYIDKFINNINKNTISFVLSIYKNNKSFINYIKEKYNNLSIINKNENCSYDYKINISIYPKDIEKIKKSKNIFYISHRVDSIFDKFDNVFYLTPLNNSKKYIIPNILPYQDLKINKNQPIFIVQGNIDIKRKNYKSLIPILEKFKDIDFKIKILGRGKIPNELKKYNNKLIFKRYYRFKDYHKEFLDTFCILPLIDESFEHNYFNNTLTSSISYGLGYNLLFLCHYKLKDIYRLKKYVSYTDNSDICIGFNKCLQYFYMTNSIKI